jgi:NAD(P)-dependent dehydrogenase (short-subunit alcohol dehydrogenase family)
LFGASSLLARDPSRLKETAASISSDTVWQAADVVDAEQVLDAVSQLASDLDGFDAVVTASGFGTHFDTRALVSKGAAEVRGLRGVCRTSRASNPLHTSHRRNLTVPLDGGHWGHMFRRFVIN